MLPSPASLALPSSSVYPSMSDMDSRLLGERYREYMKGLIKRAERKGVFENEHNILLTKTDITYIPTSPPPPPSPPKPLSVAPPPNPLSPQTFFACLAPTNNSSYTVVTETGNSSASPSSPPLLKFHTTLNYTTLTFPLSPYPYENLVLRLITDHLRQAIKAMNTPRDVGVDRRRIGRILEEVVLGVGERLREVKGPVTLGGVEYWDLLFSSYCTFPALQHLTYLFSYHSPTASIQSYLSTLLSSQTDTLDPSVILSCNFSNVEDDVITSIYDRLDYVDLISYGPLGPHTSFTEAWLERRFDYIELPVLDPFRIEYFNSFLKSFYNREKEGNVELVVLRTLEYGLQSYLAEDLRGGGDGDGVNGILLVLSECVGEEGERRRVAARMLGKVIVTCGEIERIRSLAILASLPPNSLPVTRYVIPCLASPCLMLREVASSIPITNWSNVKLGLIDLLLDAISSGSIGSPLELHSALLHLKDTRYFSIGRSLAHYVLTSDTGISFMRMSYKESVYSGVTSVMMEDDEDLNHETLGLNDYDLWKKMEEDNTSEDLHFMIDSALAKASGTSQKSDFVDQRKKISNRVKLGLAKSTLYCDLKSELLTWSGPSKPENYDGPEFYYVEYEGKSESHWINLPRENGSISFLADGPKIVRLPESVIVERVVRPVKKWLKKLGLTVKVSKETGGRGRRLIIKKVAVVVGEKDFFVSEGGGEVFEVEKGGGGVIQNVVNCMR
ncbi:hypothetical protein TrLO_g5219 [Triparma laevis f. longispina]|uniref:Uncharacterized protein n=1 Tax=Triparma laevis f. longispina TaxID=1714387 RepID=A0A9W7AB43_9STRA|nr:hypothetical protein TrLO_g5219 [Triparma laevis f. longispina]